MKMGMLIWSIITSLFWQEIFALQKGMNDMQAMWNAQTIAYSKPFSYDVALAAQRGLANESGFLPEYFKLQAFYADALWSYINERAGLNDLDRVFCDHELNFIPAQERSFYQQFGANNMNFLFLRNNVCIERLDPEDLDALRDLAQADVVDEAAVSLAVRTFSFVLKANASESDDMMILYEADGKMAQNNAIVIGFASSEEYDADGNFVSAENEMLKDGFLEAVAPEIEKLASEALGHPVAVFLY